MDCKYELQTLLGYKREGVLSGIELIKECISYYEENDKSLSSQGVPVWYIVGSLRGAALKL